MWSKVKRLSTAFAIMAGSVGALDQLGAGAQLMSELTSVPVEVLPEHAPPWVQGMYLGVVALSIVLRFMAIMRLTAAQREPNT